MNNHTTALTAALPDEAAMAQMTQVQLAACSNDLYRKMQRIDHAVDALCQQQPMASPEEAAELEAVSTHLRELRRRMQAHRVQLDDEGNRRRVAAKQQILRQERAKLADAEQRIARTSAAGAERVAELSQKRREETVKKSEDYHARLQKASQEAAYRQQERVATLLERSQQARERQAKQQATVAARNAEAAEQRRAKLEEHEAKAIALRDRREAELRGMRERKQVQHGGRHSSVRQQDLPGTIGAALKLPRLTGLVESSQARAAATRTGPPSPHSPKEAPDEVSSPQTLADQSVSLAMQQQYPGAAGGAGGQRSASSTAASNAHASRLHQLSRARGKGHTHESLEAHHAAIASRVAERNAMVEEARSKARAAREERVAEARALRQAELAAAQAEQSEKMRSKYASPTAELAMAEQSRVLAGLARDRQAHRDAVKARADVEARAGEQKAEKQTRRHLDRAYAALTDLCSELLGGPSGGGTQQQQHELRSHTQESGGAGSPMRPGVTGDARFASAAFVEPQPSGLYTNRHHSAHSLTKRTPRSQRIAGGLPSLTPEPTMTSADSQQSDSPRPDGAGGTPQPPGTGRSMLATFITTGGSHSTKAPGRDGGVPTAGPSGFTVQLKKRVYT